MYGIIGLGNPGFQYQSTRHNAGFLVVDRLAEDWGLEFRNSFQSKIAKFNRLETTGLLVKPQTYMNLSGQAVNEITRFYKIPFEKILIVCDDLDLPLGTIRLRPSGSAGGHRGVDSIINNLGTNRLARLKIGIGRPDRDTQISDYVLTPFTEHEKSMLNRVIDWSAQAVTTFIEKGLEYAMNHFNAQIKDPNCTG